MAKTIETDMDLLAAALSQVRVSVWQADATDVYCEVDRGFIDKYTPKSVRVISEKTGQPTYYWRDSTLFVIE
jgi:hypothetical protein